MVKKFYTFVFLIQGFILIIFLVNHTLTVCKRLELLRSFNIDEVYSYFWGKEFYENIKKVENIIPPEDNVCIETKSPAIYFVAYAIMPRKSFSNFTKNNKTSEWCPQDRNVWIIKFEDSSLKDIKIYKNE